MSKLYQELIIEKERLCKNITHIEKQLTLRGKIENVNVMLKGNTAQFYVKDSNARYHYIHSNNTADAIQTIKQQYYNRLFDSAKKELALVNKLQQHLENNSFDKIYDKLGKAKQQVITPIEIPEKQLITNWLSEKYEGKPFGENDREIYTERGERVRSKSEKIIADKLYHENILYHYEYPLQIPGWGIIYPDFTILDVPNRRKIIYEHFGMMDDPEYAANANSKLNKYAAAGYNIGVNLYITMETSENPFDSRTLNGLLAMLNHSTPKPSSSVNL